MKTHLVTGFGAPFAIAGKLSIAPIVELCCSNNLLLQSGKPTRPNKLPFEPFSRDGSVDYYLVADVVDRASKLLDIMYKVRG